MDVVSANDNIGFVCDSLLIKERERVGLEIIVSVTMNDELSGGVFKRGLSYRRDTAVGFISQKECLRPSVGVEVEHASDNTERAVGGCIVNDDVFNIVESLSEEAVYASFDKPRGLIYGHYDGDGRHY